MSFQIPSAGPAFNPARQREVMRGVLALSLVVLVVAEVLAGFYFLINNPEGFDNLRELLALVFGASTTLLGTVVGFYFGEKSAKSASAND